MEQEEMHALRTADEVARRTICLHCANAVAQGVSKDDVSAWLKDEGLWGSLSPRETRVMEGHALSEKELIWMTWFAESQFVLLWAIGKIERMPPPVAKCDTGEIMEVMPGLFDATKPFIHSAVLRPEDVVRGECDSIYDIHCDVGKALRHGKQVPAGYDNDVVFYRHYALNWLTGYGGQAWDEVTPDI